MDTELQEHARTAIAAAELAAHALDACPHFDAARPRCSTLWINAIERLDEARLAVIRLVLATATRSRRRDLMPRLACAGLDEIRWWFHFVRSDRGDG